MEWLIVGLVLAMAGSFGCGAVYGYATADKKVLELQRTLRVEDPS